MQWTLAADGDRDGCVEVADLLDVLVPVLQNDVANDASSKNDVFSHNNS